MTRPALGLVRAVLGLVGLPGLMSAGLMSAGLMSAGLVSAGLVSAGLMRRMEPRWPASFW